ncbi:gliding motility protein GldN [Ilyomonas limi]|uniref:Gliding motility protein GldN n=2 Tax=Ilyomonas limi TaxID=2575867 RepID=A0A4U3KTL9_9BACT|nr:gliding motility protein GldN [Ilyomonas limi]
MKSGYQVRVAAVHCLLFNSICIKNWIMQVKYFKSFAVLVLAIVLVNTGMAQRKKQVRSAYGNTPSAYGNTGNNKAADTTIKNNNQAGYGNANTGNQSTYGNTAPADNGIDTTLPINVIPSTSGGLLDTLRPSLREDAAVDRDLILERTPLEYQNIREDDAIFRVRVWREIDTREKINMPFRYAAVEDNGSQRFISILLRAIQDGSVTAFSADDDRFTTPITPDQAISAFGGGFDTSRVYDMQGNITGYQVRAKAVDPDSIYKFRLKEEWIFDKATSRMYVRILGIAPVIPVTLSNGMKLENSDHPVWWIYYPDLRSTLTKYQAYNPKNMGARMTWDELFENRMFSSYITKSTLDNPFDQSIREYIKDPLFRLYQGENVKDKIFDYEQSLWSY